MLASVRRKVRTAALHGLDTLTGSNLQGFILALVRHRAQRLPPDDALRFVLGLEADFYPLEGKLSVAYDKGLHTKHRHMRYHDFFVDRIGAGERVLDIGCGPGKLAFEIASRADARVLAVDIMPHHVERARREFQHENVRYEVADATADLPGETFDVAVLSNVLEHLHERPVFLRKVVAAARPKRLLIRVPLFERDWRVPLKKELGLEWRLDKDHKIEYTLDEVANELGEAGLAIAHQEVHWGEVWLEARSSDETTSEDADENRG